MEGTQFVIANEAARDIAEAAIVAYWMDRSGNPHGVEFQQKHMRHRLDRLCEIMGLRLVDAEPAPRPLPNLEDA